MIIKLKISFVPGSAGLAKERSSSIGIEWIQFQFFDEKECLDHSSNSDQIKA